MKVHSKDLVPERLRQLLADYIANDEASQFRRYFFTRFAVVAVVVWLLSWPIHLLPKTLLWSLLAAAVFGYGLMSPPRHRTR